MVKFYAVARGRKTGIFISWTECKKQVKGFSGAIFKSFKLKSDAEKFLNFLLKKRKRDNDENLPEKKRRKTVIEVYTDGGCENNGTKKPSLVLEFGLDIMIKETFQDESRETKQITEQN